MLKRYGEKAVEESTIRARGSRPPAMTMAPRSGAEFATAVAQLANNTPSGPVHSSERSRNDDAAEQRRMEAKHTPPPSRNLVMSAAHSPNGDAMSDDYERPFLEDGSQFGISQDAFAEMEPAEQRELMIQWFLNNFEDTQNETPWDGETKEYMYILGWAIRRQR